MYDSDSLSDSDDDISALDFSSMPKRQSRRQRGLAPEFSDASNDLYDSLVWLKINSFQPVAVCVSEKTDQQHYQNTLRVVFSRFPRTQFDRSIHTVREQKRPFFRSVFKKWLTRLASGCGRHA